MSTAWRQASRVAATPSMPASPTSVSMSTWLRMQVEPLATDKAAWRADWRAGSMPHSFFRRRSVSILSTRRGPAWCGRQPIPSRVLSRWVCASTRPGRASAPPPSSTATPPGSMSSSIRAIRPSSMRMSTLCPPQGRTLRISRLAVIRWSLLAQARTTGDLRRRRDRPSGHPRAPGRAAAPRGGSARRRKGSVDGTRSPAAG